MTLFTNKEDRRLPLLTQFYQVKGYYTADEEIGPISKSGNLPPEADRFIYLYSHGFSDECYQNDLTWTKDPNLSPIDFEFPYLDSCLIFAVTSNWYEFFALFQYTVCEIMDFLALSASSGENFVFKAEWQAKLKDWKEQEDSWIKEMETNDEYYKVFETAPPLHILNAYKEQFSNREHFILGAEGIGICQGQKNQCFTLVHDVIVDLTEAIKAGNNLHSCRMCDNVFLRKRKDREWCSDRCASLVRKKRQRRIATLSNPMEIAYNKWSEKHSQFGDAIPEFIAWMEADKGNRPELEEMIKSVREWDDRRKAHLTI